MPLVLALLSVLITLLSAQIEYRAASTHATIFATTPTLSRCLLQASLSADMRLPMEARPDANGNFQLANLQPGHRYFLRLTCDGTLTEAAVLFTEPDSPPVTLPAADCSVPAREVTAPATGGLLHLSPSPDCGQSLSKEASWLRFQPHSSDAVIQLEPNPGAARQTTVRVGSEEVLIRQAPSTTCSFSLGSSWYPGTAGSYTLTIPAPPGCAWSILSAPNWVIPSSTTSGTGVGQISYSLAANGNSLRSGQLLLSTGQAFTLNQLPGACTGNSDNTSWFPVAGGTYTFDLGAASGCSWTLASSANWVRVNSAASGSGPATVSYTIDPNTGLSRSASLVATFSGGAVTRTIQQPAYLYNGTCTYTFASPTYNLSAGAQTQSIAITTPNGCSWTLVSNTTWAVPQVASGYGPASVVVQVAANDTTSQRTATLSIGGQTVALVQAGAACNPTFASRSSYFPSAAGTYTVLVNAPEGCPWNPSASLIFNIDTYSFERIAAIVGGPMSGTGLLTFSLPQNHAPSFRTGSLWLASGSNYTINQVGDPCGITFFPVSTWVPYWQATWTITVITGAGCPWTVTSSSPWIQLLTPSGTGPGEVSFTTIFNVSPDARSGQLSSRNAKFPISQAGWK